MKDIMSTNDLVGGGASGNFFRLMDGDNYFRIVKMKDVGFRGWLDKKPVYAETPAGLTEKGAVDSQTNSFKKVYAALVIRRGTEDSQGRVSLDQVGVLEIDRATLIKGLQQIGSQPGRDNFQKYDIRITKTGQGKETRYSIVGLIIKPLTTEEVDMVREAKINLEQIYAEKLSGKSESAPESETSAKEPEIIEPSTPEKKATAKKTMAVKKETEPVEVSEIQDEAPSDDDQIPF